MDNAKINGLVTVFANCSCFPVNLVKRDKSGPLKWFQ
jgi:hypothetical protein